jgi:integrative and conjugative element protein (TIGR02256 family)
VSGSTFHLTRNVRVVVPLAALTAIYDECDRYEADETGGRVIGTFEQKGGKLELHINGIIEPGPGARRTVTSFFQDGHHQERVFRSIEASHPEIEHLGNWHTHHVNGYPQLSGGDITTYQRTVNHPSHNTPFFYALLVTAKNLRGEAWERYTIKHYLVRRDDERVYEVPARHVEVVEAPVLWPPPAEAPTTYSAAAVAAYADAASHAAPAASMQRVYDKDILGEFFSQLRPYSNPKLGVYWRGPLDLVDGSKVEAVLLEAQGGKPSYSMMLRGVPEHLRAEAEDIAQLDFPTARAALIATERRCNKVLYEVFIGSRKP